MGYDPGTMGKDVPEYRPTGPAIRIMVALMAIQTTVLLALLGGGIPWAYGIGQRLTTLEAHLTNLIPAHEVARRSAMDDMRERVVRLEEWKRQQDAMAKAKNAGG